MTMSKSPEIGLVLISILFVLQCFTVQLKKKNNINYFPSQNSFIKSKGGANEIERKQFICLNHEQRDKTIQSSLSYCTTEPSTTAQIHSAARMYYFLFLFKSECTLHTVINRPCRIHFYINTVKCTRFCQLLLHWTGLTLCDFSHFNKIFPIYCDRMSDVRCVPHLRLYDKEPWMTDMWLKKMTTSCLCHQNWQSRNSSASLNTNKVRASARSEWEVVSFSSLSVTAPLANHIGHMVLQNNVLNK